MKIFARMYTWTSTHCCNFESRRTLHVRKYWATSMLQQAKQKCIFTCRNREGWLWHWPLILTSPDSSQRWRTEPASDRRSDSSNLDSDWSLNWKWQNCAQFGAEVDDFTWILAANYLVHLSMLSHWPQETYDSHLP